MNIFKRLRKKGFNLPILNVQKAITESIEEQYNCMSAEELSNYSGYTVIDVLAAVQRVYKDTPHMINQFTKDNKNYYYSPCIGCDIANIIGTALFNLEYEQRHAKVKEKEEPIEEVKILDNTEPILALVCPCCGGRIDKNSHKCLYCCTEFIF